MSTLFVENLKGPTTGSNANKVIIPTGQTLQIDDGVDYSSMPAGTVIQQVSNFAVSTFSTNSGTYVTTDSSVSITPRFSNSQMAIWICGSTHYAASNHGRGQIRKNGAAFSNFNHDDLLSYITLSNARGHPVSMCYCDTNVGTTSAVTYAYYVYSPGGLVYHYRNQGILVQEIKA